MNSAIYKYISTIKFSELYNWSFQYTTKYEHPFTDKYKRVKIGTFLTRIKDMIDIENDKTYKRVSIKLYNGGVFLRDIEKGINIGTKKQFRIKEGDILLSKIDARNGAIGVVPKVCDNAIITGNFWTFEVNTEIVIPLFLSILMRTNYFIRLFDNASNGTTNRHYLQEDLFLNTEIPLPSIKEQMKILEKYNNRVTLLQNLKAKELQLKKEVEKYLFETLGLKINKNIQIANLQLINFSDMRLWGINKIFANNIFASDKYKLITLLEKTNMYTEIFRGKSPKYSDTTTSIILNQKCNRWNSIDLQYAKTVSEKWLSTVDNKFKTKENDILINSTGEGTIGRATCIDKQYTGLLYDSHMLLLRLNTNLVNPLYYTYLLNSSFGQEQINHIKSAQSTNQTELGIDNLKLIKFPCPKIEIQNNIVAYLNELNKNIIDIHKQIQKNKILAQEELEKEIFK